jgi:hypothetical protein
MTAIKSSELPAMPTAAQPRLQPVPKKVRQAIELLVSGQCSSIKKAAEKVGWARETLSRRLSQPECAEALRTRAAREVAMSAGRAAARLSRLIDSTSERVAFEATRFALATAGIKPASDAQFTVNLDLRAGYVLDLREHIDRSPSSVAIDGAGGIVVDAKPLHTPVPKATDAE